MTDKRYQTWAVSALVAAVVWFAGCETSGYRKHDAAALNSEAAAVEVQAVSGEIEAVIEALNQLVNQPAPDAKPQFLKFCDALDRLAGSARRAGRGVDRLSQKQAAYFAAWDKEIAVINDEVIRRSSEARKAEVSRQLETAIRQYDDTQSSLRPLADYLTDIRTALSTDLTREGLTAAQPMAASARERASRVQTALAQSATELDALSARLASFRVHDVK